MRASTVLSLLIALFLAGAAVFGVRAWMSEQRNQIIASSMEQQSQTGSAAANMIVVAKAPMSFGEIITAEKLETIPWASSALPEGAFTSVDALVGATEETTRFVLASIQKGEPILTNKVTVPGQRAKLSTAIEPGMKAVSIRVNDVLGVAGFVLPGDRVDVMLTRMPRQGEVDPYVDVLLQGVKVLAIDQSVDDRKDVASVVKTVTFEVTTEEAQKLTLGANAGTLSLTLRSFASSGIVESKRMTLSMLSEDDVSEALKIEAAERAAQEREAQAIALAEEQPAEEIVEQNVVEVVEIPTQSVTVRVYRNGQQQDYEVNGTSTGE